jgi:hypothetical protein
MTGSSIRIPDWLDTALISSYMTGKITNVIYFDPTQAYISTTLIDHPRHWYYLRVMALHPDVSTSLLSSIVGTIGRFL